jgi:hypothetical protein
MHGSLHQRKRRRSRNRHCLALLHGISLPTLGVHENPSGDNQTEYKHLVSGSQKNRNLISAQSMARSGGWIAYRSFYLPSVSYSLPSTSFSRQELATIQRSPIEHLFLQWGSTGTFRSSGRLWPNLPRGYWPTASIRLTGLPKDLLTTTTHSVTGSIWSNDVDQRCRRRSHRKR